MPKFKAVKGVRLLVPDGSLKDVVHKLLEDAGLGVSYSDGDRSYRGQIRNERLFPPPFDSATRMRPQDACWVVADGRADLAFAGDDLVVESGRQKDLVILNRYPLSRGGVGKTKLVVAVPNESPIKKAADLRPEHELATEYPNIAKVWLAEKGIEAIIRSCHGSLEAFSDLTDAILENKETGRSLEVGRWRIIAEVMEAQCCLITHPAALANPAKSAVIYEVKRLLDSVMAGRDKRLLKCNVMRCQANLSQVLAILPSAGAPTVNKLADDSGWAIETIVPAAEVPALLIALCQAKATAIFDQPVGRYIAAPDFQTLILLS